MSDTAVGSYYQSLSGAMVGPFETNEERDRQALIGDGPWTMNHAGDADANPDPNRTLNISVAADGVVWFTANFREPGCFTGHFDPATSGVVAYIYDVDAVALDDETECVTCLDTYEAIAQADEARAAAREEAGVTAPTPAAKRLDTVQEEALADLWEANTSREFDAILALSAEIGFERAKAILESFAS